MVGQDIAKKKSTNVTWLTPYFWFSYIVLLFNTFDYTHRMEWQGPLSVFFSLAVYLFYGFAYTTIVFVPLFLMYEIVSLKFVKRHFEKSHLSSQYAVYVLAILLGTFLQVFLYADKFIFRLYLGTLGKTTQIKGF